MSYAEAIGLALLQALTEFLPVSSSGHLVLAQRWLGYSQIDTLYNVAVHVATMAAVLVYLRGDVAALVGGLFRPSAGPGGVFAGHERRALWFIALANLPTALIGLFIKEFLENASHRPAFVGVMLIVTGLVLWWGRGRVPRRGIAAMGAKDALAVGVLQGLAVLPGISRSGTTIAGGLMLGLDRELAARFSLLVSVPAILGATLLEVLDAGDLYVPAAGPYLVAMVVAGVVGYLAVDVILRLVRRQRFYLFAFYVWPLGALAIVSQVL